MGGLGVAGGGGALVFEVVWGELGSGGVPGGNGSRGI